MFIDKIYKAHIVLTAFSGFVQLYSNIHGGIYVAFCVNTVSTHYDRKTYVLNIC